MTAQEILNKRAKQASTKGPVPKINSYLDKFLSKHGDRLGVSDLEVAIATLTSTRQTNAEFEAQVAQAESEVAAQKAAEAAEAARAAVIGDSAPVAS